VPQYMIEAKMNIRIWLSEDVETSKDSSHHILSHPIDICAAIQVQKLLWPGVRRDPARPSLLLGDQGGAD
jgi:hypothetical protein